MSALASQYEEVKRNSKATRLAMAMHDLKGHLAVISGQAKLLRAGKLGAVTSPQVAALADIVSGCQLIDQQLSGILTAGIRESSPWEPVLATSDLRQCLLYVYNSLQAELADGQLQFEIKLCDLPMLFPFDAHLVTRVLMNLVQNARRFTPPGGCVKISLAPHFWERRSAQLPADFERRGRYSRKLPNAAKIVVADSGCGIAHEYHQEIFEEYFSKPAPGGSASSGLGLAIAHNIVQAHGGKIWVESAPGKGSSFCFLLPYVAPSSTSDSQAELLHVADCGD
jgi:signal transduction histidine kinase